MSQSVSSAVIALLTDFGLHVSVGVMKGVMSRIAPPVTHFIDIAHDIPPQDIATGAWVLEISYRYFPRGTVFLCVIDPGVGSERRPVAIRAGDWYFVGPDNGIFTSVLEEQTVHEAVVLENPVYHLPTVSATFQGRDIFSPVAAHIASGVRLTELGMSVEASALRKLEHPRPQVSGDRIEAQIIYVDHYGNLITNIRSKMVPDDFFEQTGLRLAIPSRQVTITQRRHFFADASQEGEQKSQPFLFIDSTGYIGIAIQNGDASKHMSITVGESVMLQW